MRLSSILSIAIIIINQLITKINGEYQWHNVKLSDVTSESEQGITSMYSVDEVTGNLIIDATILNRGCGDVQSHIFVSINDNIDGKSNTKWSKIRYTQEFWGASTCWSLFGNIYYGQYPGGLQTGLIEFDTTNEEDIIIANTLFYGKWDGETRKCDVSTDNFWHGNGATGYKGALVIEQRRDIDIDTAGIVSGHSCSTVDTTMIRFSNIQVGYYSEPDCKCNSDIGLDIMFLMDESQSVKLDEWNVMIDFVSVLIDSDLNDQSYVSLVEYEEKISEFKQFLDFTYVEGNRETIINALEANSYDTSGNTDTDDAIIWAFDLFTTWDNNNDINNERPNLLFVLTDDYRDFCTDKLESAFNNHNVEVILIGIGSTVEWETRLTCLYSDGSNAYGVSSFNDEEFESIRSVIRDEICL